MHANKHMHTSVASLGSGRLIFGFSEASDLGTKIQMLKIFIESMPNWRLLQRYRLKSGVWSPTRGIYKKYSFYPRLNRSLSPRADSLDSACWAIFERGRWREVSRFNVLTIFATAGEWIPVDPTAQIGHT